MATSAEKGRRAKKGEARQYIQEVVLPHRGRECLIWPFFRCDKGYGRVFMNGRTVYVTRLACEAANGPPPTPDHEAAHNCGKGHEGCCNPLHLEWKTHADNMRDMAKHGTKPVGERHGNAKLTTADVDVIRAMRGRLKLRELSQIFGVGTSGISAIQRGLLWATHKSPKQEKSHV